MQSEWLNVMVLTLMRRLCGVFFFFYFEWKKKKTHELMNLRWAFEKCAFFVCQPDHWQSLCGRRRFIQSEFTDSANILLSFFIVASSIFAALIRIYFFESFFFVYLVHFFLCWPGKLVSLIKSTNKNASAWAVF